MDHLGEIVKLQQIETVTRYQIYFDPPEAAVLARHPKWRHRIGRRKSGQPGGDATLTKTELSEVCDALGVNGREWLALAMARRFCHLTNLIDEIEGRHGQSMLESPDVVITNDVCLAIGSYVPRNPNGFKVVTRGVFQDQPDGTAKVVAPEWLREGK